MKIIGGQASVACVYGNNWIVLSLCPFVFRLRAVFPRIMSTSVVPEGERIDFRFRRLSARRGGTRNNNVSVIRAMRVEARPFFHPVISPGGSFP